jgi:hypothetical protein
LKQPLFSQLRCSDFIVGCDFLPQFEHARKPPWFKSNKSQSSSDFYVTQHSKLFLILFFRKVDEVREGSENTKRVDIAPLLLSTVKVSGGEGKTCDFDGIKFCFWWFCVVNEREPVGIHSLSRRQEFQKKKKKGAIKVKSVSEDILGTYWMPAQGAHNLFLMTLSSHFCELHF